MKPTSIPAVVAACLLGAATPVLAETVNCTNITTLPHIIAAPGVYCLKQDLATSITSGAAITINANSVTIDFNGYRLGGLGGGPSTGAFGVYAENRKNIALRNGSIRGFRRGIFLNETSSGSSSGHVVENNLLDLNTNVGIWVSGGGVVVKDNRVLNTSGDGVVIGINGANLDNSRIVGNLITGLVSSSNQAYAIVVDTQSANVEIARNTILDTKGGFFAGGVWTVSAGHVARDNVIIGVTAGTGNGIWNTSGGSLICRDNIVANVTTTPTVGCTSETGTFPPPGP